MFDSHAFDTFCTTWLDKARAYEMHDLANYFDKFATLYIVFNTVYTEASRRLSRTQPLPPYSSKKPSKVTRLSDRASATDYVVRYYGWGALRSDIRQDQQCRAAVDTLVRLINDGTFYFHWDYQTGDPETDKDQLEVNKAARYDPRGILSLIYQARCNLFHGAKAYEESQRVLLENLIIILEFITLRVFEKLRGDLSA